MALNLGTLNVVFTAQTRDFDRGMRKVKRSIQQLDGRATEALDETAESTERIGRAAQRTGAQTSKFGKNMKALGNKLRVLAFIGGALAGTIVALRQEMAGLAVAAGAVVTAVLLEPVRQQFRATATAVSEVNDRMKELERVADEAGTRVTAIGAGMADVVSAFTAAGSTMQAGVDVVEGFAENMRGLGMASEDVQSKLEDVAEITKSGTTTMEELRDMVSFTARPVETLANAFDITTGKVLELQREGKELSRDVLVRLGQHLEDTAQDTTTLASQFNRLINTITGLLDATGIANAVEDVMGRLDDALQSARFEVFLQNFSDAIEDFIRNTLPEFTRSMIQNWDTIVTATKTAIGALIGAAVGGAPGALIGALIGGMEKTAAVMGKVGDAIGFMSENFRATAATISGLFVGRALTSLISKMHVAIATAGTLRAALAGVAASMATLGVGAIVGGIAGGLAIYAEHATRARRQTDNLIDKLDDMKSRFDDMSESRLREFMPQIQSFLELARKRAEGFRNQLDALPDPKTARGGSSAAGMRREELLEDLEKEQDRIDQLTRLYKALGEAIGASNDEREKQKEKDADAILGPLSEKGAGGSRRVARTMEAFGERVKVSMKKFTGLREEVRDIVDRMERLEQAGREAGDTIADAFTRAVIEGGKLSDMLEQLGRDIARIILRANVSKPMANMLGEGAGQLFASMFGPGQPTAPSSGARTPMPSTGSKFAEGGIATKPSIFGEAGPEAAIPLKNGSIPVDMKGGGSRVVINDMRGADAPAVEQEESRGPDGQRMIELTIRDTVAGQMQRGELDGPMRKRFGVGPTTRGR